MRQIPSIPVKKKQQQKSSVRGPPGGPANPRLLSQDGYRLRIGNVRYLVAPVDVLHGLELVELLAGGDVAAVDLVDRLPEEVRRDQVVLAELQLDQRREEPPPQRQARGRRRAVVLDVDVVRDLVLLQFPFCAPTASRIENNR